MFVRCICPRAILQRFRRSLALFFFSFFMFARVCAAATPNRLIMCSLHQMTQTLDSGGERADVLMESMHAMKARVVGAGGSTGIACLKNTYVVPRWLLWRLRFSNAWRCACVEMCSLFSRPRRVYGIRKAVCMCVLCLSLCGR